MGRKQPQKPRSRWKPILTSSLTCLHTHRAALALILFLLAFHGTTNYVVMRQDTVFFDRNAADQYIDAAHLSRWSLSDIVSEPTRVLTWRSALTDNPIGSPGFAALFMSVFGFTQDTAVMSNIVWLAILLTSVYIIALKLFNMRCALLSTPLASFFPGIVAATRGFVKDFPLAAMVSLSLALLLYSDGMKRRLPAVLFGFAIALTALTNGSFILYLSLPFLLTVVIPLIKTHRRHGFTATRGPLINCLIATTIVLLLASPWYLNSGREYVMSARMDGRDYQPHSQRPFILFGLGDHLSPVLLILAFCAFVIIWNSPGGLFLLAWVVPPIIFYLTQGFTTPYYAPSSLRFFLPTIAAFAIPPARLVEILLGSVADKLRKASRIFFAGCILLLCAGMLFTLYVTFLEYRDLQGPLEDGKFTPRHLNLNYRISPVQMEADVGAAVDALMGELEARNTPATLFVTNHLGPITTMVLTELEVRQTLGEKHLFNRVQCIRGDDRPLNWTPTEECIQLVTSADYLIVEDMNAIPEAMVSHEAFAFMLDYTSGNTSSFRTVAALSTRDIDELYYDTFQIMEGYGYTVPEESFIRRGPDGFPPEIGWLALAQDR